MISECQALRGCTVVVTRAEHQARSFGEKLVASGALVHYLPLIRIEAAPTATPPEPELYDWLILTSANSVAYFGRMLAAAGLDYAAFSGARTAVIGEATAEALKQYGLHAEIIPEKHDSDALIAALLRAETQPALKRVLLPQSSKARSVIADALTARGMVVDALTCYRTCCRVPGHDEVERLVVSRPDAITFFSPSAVEAYQLGKLSESLRAVSCCPLYASIGPVTTLALNHAGFSPIIEASAQNEDNLISRMNAHFACAFE